jgi:hypothetical protein
LLDRQASSGEPTDQRQDTKSFHTKGQVVRTTFVYSQSIQRPRPSIEIRTSAACRTPVKRGEVNWLPWSELKMSGRPNCARGQSTAKSPQSFERSDVIQPNKAAVPNHVGIDDSDQLPAPGRPADQV